MKTAIITILIGIALVFLSMGCGDITGVSETQKDNAGLSVNVNYNKDGRVYNLNCVADSVTFGESNLFVYSDRVYQIHKDSLINFIIK